MVEGKRLEGQRRWPSTRCWIQDPINFERLWMHLSGTKKKKKVALGLNLNIHEGIYLLTKTSSPTALLS